MTMGSATTTTTTNRRRTTTEQHLAGLTERNTGGGIDKRIAESHSLGSAVTREWQQHEKQLNNKK